LRRKFVYVGIMTFEKVNVRAGLNPARRRTGR